MNLEILIGTIYLLVMSLVLIWITSAMITKYKKIKLFLPFVLIGFTWCIQSGAMLFSLFNFTIWSIYEGLIFLSFIGILINLRRDKLWKI